MTVGKHVTVLTSLVWRKQAQVASEVLSWGWVGHLFQGLIKEAVE